MPQTKEERAEYRKQYYLKNKEKLLEQQKQYNLDTKEKRAEYKKQYNLDNKEKIAKKRKEYQQTPEGKKSHTISNWKYIGLIWDTQEEIDEIYNRWLISKKCEKCNEEYTETNWKCMDHIHEDGKYGKFRNVLCNSCNSKTDRQIHSNNSSGVPNIYWSNTKKRWIYDKKNNKKRHRKLFPYFIQAVIYKREYEESLL